MSAFFNTADLAGREESALNLDFWKLLNQSGGGMGKVLHRPLGGTGVPVFELFGERQTWPTPDLLHCESIPERSRVHDWEITQHRHADLGQFVYVQSGHALLDVEGTVSEIDEPAVQVVPPMCVHGFRFSRNIAGYVITLALPLFDWLQDSLGDAAPALLRAGCHEVGADKPYIDQLCQRIACEYGNVAPGRDFVLHSLVGALNPRTATYGILFPAGRAAFSRALVRRPVRCGACHYGGATQPCLPPVAGMHGARACTPSRSARGEAQSDLHDHVGRPGCRFVGFFRRGLFFALLPAAGAGESA
jgi:hypothetical protein